MCMHPLMCAWMRAHACRWAAYHTTFEIAAFLKQLLESVTTQRVLADASSGRIRSVVYAWRPEAAVFFQASRSGDDIVLGVDDTPPPPPTAPPPEGSSEGGPAQESGYRRAAKLRIAEMQELRVCAGKVRAERIRTRHTATEACPASLSARSPAQPAPTRLPSSPPAARSQVQGAMRRKLARMWSVRRRDAARTILRAVRYRLLARLPAADRARAAVAVAFAPPARPPPDAPARPLCQTLPHPPRAPKPTAHGRRPFEGVQSGRVLPLRGGGPPPATPPEPRPFAISMAPPVFAEGAGLEEGLAAGLATGGAIAFSSPARRSHHPVGIAPPSAFMGDDAAAAAGTPGSGSGGGEGGPLSGSWAPALHAHPTALSPSVLLGGANGAAPPPATRRHDFAASPVSRARHRDDSLGRTFPPPGASSSPASVDYSAILGRILGDDAVGSAILREDRPPSSAADGSSSLLTPGRAGGSHGGSPTRGSSLSYKASPHRKPRMTASHSSPPGAIARRPRMSPLATPEPTRHDPADLLTPREPRTTETHPTFGLISTAPRPPTSSFMAPQPLKGMATLLRSLGLPPQAPPLRATHTLRAPPPRASRSWCSVRLAPGVSHPRTSSPAPHRAQTAPLATRRPTRCLRAPACQAASSCARRVLPPPSRPPSPTCTPP